MCYKRTNPKRRFFNNLGLIISTTYMALTFVFKGFGYHAVDQSLAKQGSDFVEIETKPTPLNTILWDAHIETKTGYRFGHYSLLDDDKPIVFSKEYPKNHHLIDSIRDEKVIQQILRIANGWYTVTKEDERLFFNDLRFGQFGMNPNTAKIMWRYEILAGPNGEVVVERVPPKIDNMGKAFSQLWRRLKGDKSVETE